MTVLRVRDLRVRYRDAEVLRGVGLDVRAGELVVVLGGSGSGKSTLLRALLGLVPEPGVVRAETMLLGADDLLDPAVMTQARGRRIGMVFQDPQLALTPLRRTGSLVAEAAGDPDAVDALLRTSGFADPAPVIGRYAFELSGGMAQRACFALAIARSPALLLADEPTTALDGPTRYELLRSLREQADRGRAVILVTHDVSLAASADRIVVLDRGIVVETGEPGDVLGFPTSDAARTMVANAPWALPVRSRGPVEDVPPVLRLRGLTKAYPGTGPVLAGVDLAVRAGEVVGVAGLSGGGKTTLLKCLVGLEHADGGDVEVDGRPASRWGWKALRRRIQLVPQDPRGALNPWRTAVQLVADPLDFHRIGTRRQRHERAMDLLETVGLSAAAHRRPHELSTGQCQRVAIVRALAVEPRLLIADEPASALDVALQADVIEMLSGLAARGGTAALVVSHDLHILERLCDRVAVLDRGTIVEDVPAAGLRAGEHHPTTRALLDCHPTALFAPPLSSRGTNDGARVLVEPAGGES